MKNINTSSNIVVNTKSGSSSMVNFKAFGKGCGIKPIGYKTLRGFIKILKQQNKFLKKHNVKAKFDITLPVPE